MRMMLPTQRDRRTADRSLRAFFTNYRSIDFRRAIATICRFYDVKPPRVEWYEYLDWGKGAGRTYENGKIHLVHPENWKKGRKYNYDATVDSHRSPRDGPLSLLGRRGTKGRPLRRRHDARTLPSTGGACPQAAGAHPTRRNTSQRRTPAQRRLTIRCRLRHQVLATVDADHVTRDPLRVLGGEHRDGLRDVGRLVMRPLGLRPAPAAPSTRRRGSCATPACRSPRRGSRSP